MIPCLFSLLLTQTPEIRSTAADRTELGITLYHGGYAMVRERRRIHLPEGQVRLAMEDVAETIEPKTTQFHTVQGPMAVVRERNFEFDLLTPENLVKHSLGTKVFVPSLLLGAPRLEGELTSLPGLKLERERANAPVSALTSGPVRSKPKQVNFTIPGGQVATWDPGVLVRLPWGYTEAPFESLAFVTAPTALRSKPTLLMDIESIGSGTRYFELAYLAKNLDWKAMYVATLNPAGTMMDLNTFVTLTNRSGTAFPSTSLQLLAGNPNRIWDPDYVPPYTPAGVANATVEVMASASLEELGDNHIYSLSRATAIDARQVKQFALFSTREISLSHLAVTFIDVSQAMQEKRGIFSSEKTSSFQRDAWKEPDFLAVRFRFDNSESNHLGFPLPEGRIQVNQGGLSRSPIPLQECEFEATPKEEHGEFTVERIPRGIQLFRKLDPSDEVASDNKSQRDICLTIRIENSRRKPFPLEALIAFDPNFRMVRASHTPSSHDPSGLIVLTLDSPPGESFVRLFFRIDPEVP